MTTVRLALPRQRLDAPAKLRATVAGSSLAPQFVDRFDARPSAIAAAAPVQVAIPPAVQTAFDRLTRTMYERTGRVWPGYDMRDYQVIVVDPRVNQAYLWNDGGAQPGQPPRTSVFPANELGRDFERVGFMPIEWGGRAGMALSLPFAEKLVRDGESLNDPIFELAVHESFHFTRQRRFSGRFEGSLSDIKAPEPFEPRYYRQKILDGLKAAILATDPHARADAKAAAAYWNQRFKAEYPQHAKAAGQSDLLEGTARYLELFASEAATSGPDQPDAALVAKIAARINQRIPDGRFDRWWEPYDLGAVAGLSLRQEGRFDEAAWRMGRGELPVDAALEGVAPVAQPEDEVTRQKAREVVDARNAEAARRAPRAVHEAIATADLGSA